MRWLLLLVGGLGLLGRPTVAHPDSLAHRFDVATAAYAQGQYDRAVDAYRAILDDGHASGALYYNLGNAYARSDQLGQAIRYYEKARRLRPGDPRVAHNLEQVRRRAGVYPGVLPPRGLRGLVQGWSPLALFLAGGLLLGSGLAVAVVWTTPGRPDPWQHPLVWGPVAGGLLLVAVALGTSYVQSQERRAVVVAQQSPLRTAPTPTAVADTTLPEGTMVAVRDRRPPWTEVHLADGTIGWVPTRALGDI
jgi:tetratricopeptide (TPR) repeat protein